MHMLYNYINREGNIYFCINSVHNVRTCTHSLFAYVSGMYMLVCFLKNVCLFGMWV